MTTKAPTVIIGYTPQGKPVYGNARQIASNGASDVPGQTTGFVTPQLPPREDVSVWAAYWDEFLGSFWFLMLGRLFVAVQGGSVVNGVVPGVYGNAFANGFALFTAILLFGTVSGGHFNMAVTFCVWMVEFATYYIFGTKRMRVFQGKDPRQKRTLRWYTVWYPIAYPFFQLLGFFLAVLIIWGIMPGGSRSLPIELGIPLKGTATGNNGKIFGAEIMGSFFYLTGFVMLMKLFGSQNILYQFARSFAMGFLHFTLVIVFAPWAGAVWNPLAWLAFAAVSGRFTHWWLFVWPSLISSIIVAILCWVHWWIHQIPQKPLFQGSERFQLMLNQIPAGTVVYGKAGPATTPGMYNYATQQ